MNIVMSTTVHIPKALLEAVDRKAENLNISRNRLIVRVLEREVTPGSDWSPGFLSRMKSVDKGTATAVNEMLSAIGMARRSKQPKKL